MGGGRGVYLWKLEVAAGEHVMSVPHEVQEGAVRRLVHSSAAGGALPLGRGGHALALVEDHKRAQLGVALLG